jgi:TPR repeat protein/serine/threonine protein kinase
MSTWTSDKVFSRDVPQQYDLISEIRRAINLNHRNICRYHDAEVLRGTNALGETQVIQVGIMEYIEGGTIDQYLRMNPQFRQKLLMDVLRGLGYLHRHQPPIIHRDLKPSNVLVGFEDGEPVAKITDFGISKSSGLSGANVSVVGLGTYAYMAPEQLNPVRYGIGGKVRCNLDLWSFGAMTIELLTGVLPFGAANPECSTGEIMESIILGIPPPMLNGFEEPYRRVLKQCMIQHVGQRVQTAEELLKLFEAPQEAYEIPPPHRPTEEAWTRQQTVIEEVEAQPKPAAKKPKVDPPPFIPEPEPKRRKAFLYAWGGLGVLVVLFVVIGLWQASQSQPSQSSSTQDDTPYGLYVQGLTAFGEQNYSSAVDLYSRSCDGGESDGCEALADMYGTGTGVTKDSHRWEEYYGKACDLLSDASKCYDIGYDLENGTDIPQDYWAAADFYRKACDDNYPAGCNQLGVLYYEGHGVPQDYTASAPLFSKACDGGVANGCGWLGNQYDAGEGVTQDYTRSVELYTKSCDGGSAGGCANLGDNYRYGKGVTQDTQKAKELFQKGCTLGAKQGCDWLKEMQS